MKNINKQESTLALLGDMSGLNPWHSPTRSEASTPIIKDKQNPSQTQNQSKN